MTTPLPRLHHCPTGAAVILAGETRLRIIAEIERHHAKFTDGAFASLCHPVQPGLMRFGDGAGWRIRT